MTNETNERQSEIYSSVMMISPTLGFWRGHYKLPREQISLKLLDTELKKEDTTAPRAVLLTDTFPLAADGKSWLSKFRDIHNEQTKLLDRYTVSSGIRGIRIIPKLQAAKALPLLIGPTAGDLQRRLAAATTAGRLEEANVLRARLDHARSTATVFATDTPVFDPDAESQSIAFRLHQLAEAFVNDLDNVKAQIRQELPTDIWNAVHKRIPASPALMRLKFYTCTIPVEFAAASTDLQNVTTESLDAFRETAQRAVSSAVNAAIENMIREPREELLDTLESMAALIDRNGRVSTATFAPVARAVEKLKAFSFVSDKALLNKIDELSRTMDRTVPKNLNRESAAASGFADIMRSTIAEIHSSLAVDLYGGLDSGEREIII